MMRSNASGSAICCAATRPSARRSLRGHPLDFGRDCSATRGGENRDVSVHVLLPTRDFPLRHPGSGEDFFGPEHSGDRRRVEWSAEMDACLRAMRAAGQSLEECAARIGVSQMTASARCWVLGLPTHRRRQIFPVQNDRGR